MEPLSVKAFFRKQLSEAGKSYVEDLEAMSHEQLFSTPGGSARSPYDFTFEVAYVNRRVATRLSGNDPGPWSSDGWIMATDEFKNKETAVKALRESVDQVLAAYDKVLAEDLLKEIELPSGAKTSPLDLAYLVAFHTGYHDAQLNYHQAIAGDDKMHWSEG